MSLIPFPGEKNESNNERKNKSKDERLNIKIQKIFTEAIENVNCDYDSKLLDFYDELKLKREILAVLEKCLTTWDIVLQPNTPLDQALKKIGTGSFGVVYYCNLINKMTNEKRSFAIKIQDWEISEIKNLKKEIEYATTLGARGLGPHIEKTFIYTVTDINIPFNVSFGVDKIRSIILMELFETNGMALFLVKNIKSGLFTIGDTNKGFTTMLDLIKKVTDTGIFCTDIKPNNFVVKKTDQGLDVKMIDFGADFCKDNIKCDYLSRLADGERLTHQDGFSNSIGEKSRKKIKKLIKLIKNNPEQKNRYIKNMFASAWQYSLIFQVLTLIKVQKKMNDAIARKILKPALPYLNKLTEKGGDIFLDELIGVIIQCDDIYNMFVWYNRELKDLKKPSKKAVSKNDKIWHIFIKNIQEINKLYDIKNLFGGYKLKPKKRKTKRKHNRKNKKKTVKLNKKK